MATPAEVFTPVDHTEKTKTLIGALNLISRNLLLPPDVFHAISSIYNNDVAADRILSDGEPAAVEELDAPSDSHQDDSLYGSPHGGDLISEFEDALVELQDKHLSSTTLRKTKESRFQSLIQHRLTELEGLPSSWGEDLQIKCLLELYGLKTISEQRNASKPMASDDVSDDMSSRTPGKYRSFVSDTQQRRT